VGFFLRGCRAWLKKQDPTLPSPTSGRERNFEASAVTGIGARRNTPAEVIERLNAEINAAFADPVMKARLADTGGSLLPGSPADFGTLFAAEIDSWARRIKLSGAGPK
jgi:tripartite-type tricarboxylate transporter receptor subunit TctC